MVTLREASSYLTRDLVYEMASSCSSRGRLVIHFGGVGSKHVSQDILIVEFCVAVKRAVVQRIHDHNRYTLAGVLIDHNHIQKRGRMPG